jgi:hypothetical protein
MAPNRHTRKRWNCLCTCRRSDTANSRTDSLQSRSGIHNRAEIQTDSAKSTPVLRTAERSMSDTNLTGGSREELGTRAVERSGGGCAKAAVLTRVIVTQSVAHSVVELSGLSSGGALRPAAIAAGLTRATVCKLLGVRGTVREVPPVVCGECDTATNQESMDSMCSAKNPNKQTENRDVPVDHVTHKSREWESGDHKLHNICVRRTTIFALKRAKHCNGRARGSLERARGCSVVCGVKQSPSIGVPVVLHSRIDVLLLIEERST